MTTMTKKRIEIPLGGERTGFLSVQLEKRMVGIDLYPSAFDLSDEGKRECDEILRRYAQRWIDAGGKGSYVASAGRNYIVISRLRLGDAQACLDELLEAIYPNLQRIPSFDELADMEEAG